MLSLVFILCSLFFLVFYYSVSMSCVYHYHRKKKKKEVLFENCNLFPWKTQVPTGAAHLDTVERLVELQRLLIPNYL